MQPPGATLNIKKLYLIRKKGPTSPPPMANRPPAGSPGSVCSPSAAICLPHALRSTASTAGLLILAIGAAMLLLSNLKRASARIEHPIDGCARHTYRSKALARRAANFMRSGKLSPVGHGKRPCASELIGFRTTYIPAPKVHQNGSFPYLVPYQLGNNVIPVSHVQSVLQHQQILQKHAALRAALHSVHELGRAEGTGTSRLGPLRSKCMRQCMSNSWRNFARSCLQSQL